MREQQRYNLICKALEITDDSSLIQTIVEDIGNIEVKDIDQRGKEFEVFMETKGFTHKELMNLQILFDIKEIGVYGDVKVPDENVYFHMIIEL